MKTQFNRMAKVRGCVPIVAAAVWLAAGGCGGPAYEYDSVVTGTVTIEGELAPSGTITFHPVAKEGKIAIGRIYPDGSFALRTGQGDLRVSDGGTVVPGEYIVTVVVTGPAPAPTSPEGGPPSAGPLLIAERYLSRDTTDLRCTVSPGDNVVTFDLERAAAEAPESAAADDESTDEQGPDEAPAEDSAASPDRDDRAGLAAPSPEAEGATP